jgi:hypothetical protein
MSQGLGGRVYNRQKRNRGQADIRDGVESGHFSSLGLSKAPARGEHQLDSSIACAAAVTLVTRNRRGAVAIVGGGCAGLATAWQLAKQPGYEIHV